MQPVSKPRLVASRELCLAVGFTRCFLLYLRFHCRATGPRFALLRFSRIRPQLLTPQLCQHSHRSRMQRMFQRFMQRPQPKKRERMVEIVHAGTLQRSTQPVPRLLCRRVQFLPVQQHRVLISAKIDR